MHCSNEQRIGPGSLVSRVNIRPSIGFLEGQDVPDDRISEASLSHDKGRGERGNHQVSDTDLKEREMAYFRFSVHLIG